MQNPPPSEETLQKILETLERIEKHIDPPVWQKVMGFLFGHVFLIITLVGLLYGVWQIWDVVVLISSLVQSGVDGVGSIRETSGALIDQGRNLLPF